MQEGRFIHANFIGIYVFRTTLLWEYAYEETSRYIFNIGSICTSGVKARLNQASGTRYVGLQVKTWWWPIRTVQQGNKKVMAGLS